MTESEPSRFDRPIPQAAAAFAYAGALPFILSAVICWYPSDSFEAGTLARTAIETLLGFSVVILSFMGGVRWGIAASAPDGPSFNHLVIAIVPPAVAWLAMVLASDWMNAVAPLGDYRHILQLSVMIVTFLILLIADLRVKGEVPEWYPGLRIPWTLLVEASLIAALLRVVDIKFGPLFT